MQTKRWSINKSILYGAIFGLLYGIFQVTTDPTLPSEAAAFTVGTVVGGAILFSFAALLRNLIVK